jgi:hypothetical protein
MTVLAQVPAGGAETCIGFSIPCEGLAKGVLVTAMGFIIFVGCVYVLLAAVFGRRMGILVLTVAFSGWMVVLSAVWLFGFWSQGPGTKTNLGPRGAEPAWVPLESAADVSSPEYPVIEEYPEGPWTPPSPNLDASVQSVTSAVQTFLTEQANERIGVTETEPGAFATTDFSVEDIRFATAADDKTSLAAARAFYNGGGPTITVLLYHDSGSIPRYSLMFLAGSTLVFLGSLPLLDRAEKQRKDILTGGEAPPWYGPA